MNVRKEKYKTHMFYIIENTWFSRVRRLQAKRQREKKVKLVIREKHELEEQVPK